MVYDKLPCNDIKEMIAHMPENTTIIDVREPQEVTQTGGIGPSINIPLSDLKNALKKLNDKAFQTKYNTVKPHPNDQLIFFCLSENRATRGADLAHSLGYKNLKIIEGGYQEWDSNEKNKK